MGRLFGTDGVRGIANADLSCELAMGIGRAAASVLANGSRRRPVFIVGSDTRISSDMLRSAITAGLCSVGADVIALGVVPTPAVAYLVGKYKADAGVMKEAFFNKLGALTVPPEQRNFATKTNLPTYPGKIAKLKAEGARLVLVYGIGRMCHIAFWEPHFAVDFANEAEWKKAPYRLGAKLHPLTIEQNAITSFKSRSTLVPCSANTIGPGLFLQADYAIGGCDGALGRGMGWQGMSFLTTLHYGPDMHITSTFIPTLEGKLFYLKELAGPLTAECN